MDQAEQNSLRKCVQHQIQQERSDTLHRVEWKSACRFESYHSKIKGNHTDIRVLSFNLKH